MTWDAARRRRNRVGSGWDETAARTRILERDGHQCQIRAPGCLDVATECDHVVPLSITGPAGDHDGNRQAACGPCHRAKTAAEAAHGLHRRPGRRRPSQRHPGLL